MGRKVFIVLGGSVLLVSVLVVVAVVRVNNRFNESRKYDAIFESSDGVWTDSTVDIKGRRFYAVVWEFEAYKLKHHKPTVTLGRITPEPKEKKTDLKWKVPLGVSSGRARRFTDGYLPGEIEEIKKRADAAYELWNRK